MYSPTNCQNHSHKIRTIKDAISLPSKTLAQFKRDYGHEWVIGYISMWLIDLNDSANVKNKMNDVHIEFTAQRIFETYSLKVTDLTLFFRNIKEGVYGQYYENLSQEKIMEWLREYFDLRCEYAAMYSDDQHEKISMLKDGMHPKVVEEMFKGVGEEKTTYDHSTNGIGTRTKREMQKAKVITKQTDYLNKMFWITKAKPTEELKEYLINHDQTSDLYDPQVYELVERELDLRIKESQHE